MNICDKWYRNNSELLTLSKLASICQRITGYVAGNVNAGRDVYSSFMRF